MADETLTKLVNFFSRYPEVSYKKGEAIVRPGDKWGYVYYIKSGYVRCFAVSADGEELTLTVFKPRSYFFAMMPLKMEEGNYFFEAMTDLVVYRTPRVEAIEFVRHDSDVLFELLQRLGSGVLGLMSRMESLTFGSAYSKVAGVLLLSAKRFGKSNGNGQVKIDLPLTHQEIAAQAGLTRETATHQVLKLRKEGLINVEKKLYVVRDMERLAEEARLSQFG